MRVDDNLDPSPFAAERLDAHCGLHLAFGPGGRLIVQAWVCRAFPDLPSARSYAKEASDFFARNGVDRTVFVLRGPTSTHPRAAFEVADAASTYEVLATCRRQPAPAPSPGMHVRTAIAVYGLASLDGVPLQLASREVVYLPAWHLHKFQSDLVRSPHLAYQLAELIGAASPHAQAGIPFRLSDARVAALGAEASRQTAPVAAGSPHQRCETLAA